MNERERKYWVKDCLREYYDEDKKILIDISVLQITCISYFLYNLIFFGNKILIFKENLNEIAKISKQKASNKEEDIRIRNAGYILDAIQREKESNHRNIILLEKQQDIINFLVQEPNHIFCLANIKLYEELSNYGLRKKLLFLEKGKVEVNPHKSKSVKFETIGAIQFENDKMIIRSKEGTLIRVYNRRGEQRNGETLEVRPTDYILIRGKKENCYSFNLYQVVSCHSRNQAVRIIWTDLKIGEKSNKYIDRLPYEYRKMITENVD